MPRAKGPEWRAGYRAATERAQRLATTIVTTIEDDIDKRSGLSVMLWNDQEQRAQLKQEWVTKVKLILGYIR